jgi:hypothetical protein
MVAVLAGVIIETVPDFLSSNEWLVTIAHRVGGSIIALGLLDEFIVDIKIRKCRARLKEIADIAFGEVLMRATRAEQAAAEANLASVKLQTTLHRRTLHRYFDTEEEKELAKALSGFAGQTFTVVSAKSGLELDLLDDWTSEQGMFAGQLERILSAAGWIQVRLAFADLPVVRRGVTIFIAMEEVATFLESDARKAGWGLFLNLAKLLIFSQTHFVSPDKIRSLIAHGPPLPSYFENPVMLPILIGVGHA